MVERVSSARGDHVIERISLQGIRGIKSGEFSGLTAMTVLVGRNGCGKSTVLDALSIAADAQPIQRIADSISRRGQDDEHLRVEWLLYDRGRSKRSKIEISGGGANRSVTIAFAENALQVSAGHGGLLTSVGGVQGKRSQIGSSSSSSGLGPPQPVNVRFLDQRSGSKSRLPPTELYSEARRTGRKVEVLQILKSLVPTADDLEILTLDGLPTLHVSTSTASVPLSLSGDGVRNSVVLSLDLGVPDNSLILVEEPETHLHFGAMQRVAEAISYTVAPKGVATNQVVIATHSVEFIDALVSVCAKRGLQELLSVHRLSLVDGLLTTSSFSGDLVTNARIGAEFELR